MTLSPLGARALLGLPAADLAGQVVDLADLADVAPELADLPERLAAGGSWPQRRALVERALLGGLFRHGEGEKAYELRAMLAALSRTARVDEAARVLGCSRRHLSSRVRAEFGVTPKEYQRLVRFEAARGRLAEGAAAGLADVAVASGFADQAHFSREWREMAGCTPTEWLRAEGIGAVPRCSRLSRRAV